MLRWRPVSVSKWQNGAVGLGIATAIDAIRIVAQRAKDLLGFGSAHERARVTAARPCPGGADPLQ